MRLVLQPHAEPRHGRDDADALAKPAVPPSAAPLPPAPAADASRCKSSRRQTGPPKARAAAASMDGGTGHETYAMQLGPPPQSSLSTSPLPPPAALRILVSALCSPRQRATSSPARSLVRRTPL